MQDIRQVDTLGRRRRGRRRAVDWLAVALSLIACSGLSSAKAQTIRLSDGRIVEGRIASTSGVADDPDSPNITAGEVATKPIQLLYDDLRRIYIPKLMVAEVVEEGSRPPVKVKIWQNAVTGGAALQQVGPSLGVTPFDEDGRRIYHMQTPEGRLSVVQGITELTPYYAKVEALHGSIPREPMWSMRIAASSIPKDTLAKMLHKYTPQDDPTARLQLVLFYVRAERFHEAHDELKRVIDDFPDRKDLQRELRQLRQDAARRLLRELEMRNEAGQHKLVAYYLERFPPDDVAGETLAQVRQMVNQYENQNIRMQRTADRLQAIVGEISDPDQRGLAAPVAAEIVKELSRATVDRLAPFVQLLDDQTLSAEQKTALAISGWLLGADGAVRNLATALSYVKIRDGVRSYLRETLAHERMRLLTNFRSLEGATVPNVAKLIRQMKPVWHDDELVAADYGALELTAPGQTEDGDFRYLVQLPPEYDPYRRYPTIIALSDAYNTTEQELDFWAGSLQRDKQGKVVGPRRGQAMRHGYLTIAVQWRKPHQYSYEYSAREHVAALTCLRDAMRRFNVDADRIYLTGHGIGGDAAWDLAQAHPDLWAGVLPIGAFAGDSYTRHYWENAKYVPFYFVTGELDGTKLVQNSAVFDNYLKQRYNVSVIEYIGRGHEPFHDEVLNMLDWMGRQRRREPPEEFECSTLRPWDNYFWWLECRGLPEERMVYPAAWGATRRPRPVTISGRKMPAPNRLVVKIPDAESTTIWLNPDIVDFNHPTEPIRIEESGRRIRQPEGGIRPDLEVLLEDVRTRADRQRPFWAKVETQ